MKILNTILKNWKTWKNKNKTKKLFNILKQHFLILWSYFKNGLDRFRKKLLYITTKSVRTGNPLWSNNKILKSLRP